MTAKRPVRLPDSGLDALHERLQRFVDDGNLAPFTARVGSPTTFANTGVIHLPIGDGAKDAISRVLEATQLRRDKFDGRTAHITIAKVLHEEVFSCMRILSRMEIPNDALFDQLLIFCKTVSGTHEVGRFALRGK